MTVEANSSPPIHQRNDGIGLEAFAINGLGSAGRPPAIAQTSRPRSLESPLLETVQQKSRRRIIQVSSASDISALQPRRQYLHERERHQISRSRQNKYRNIRSRALQNV